LTIGGKSSDITIDENLEGVYGFIVPGPSEKDPEGNLRTSLEIHYKSSPQSKKFDSIDILEENQTIAILDKIIKYTRD